MEHNSVANKMVWGSFSSALRGTSGYKARLLAWVRARGQGSNLALHPRLSTQKYKGGVGNRSINISETRTLHKGSGEGVRSFLFPATAILCKNCCSLLSLDNFYLNTSFSQCMDHRSVLFTLKETSYNHIFACSYFNDGKEGKCLKRCFCKP